MHKIAKLGLHNPPGRCYNDENAGDRTCTVFRVSAYRPTVQSGRRAKTLCTEIRSITMAHTVSSECVACGACVDTCPVGAISMADKAVVDAATCIDCGACEGVCPTGAIQPE